MKKILLLLILAINLQGQTDIPLLGLRATLNNAVTEIDSVTVEGTFKVVDFSNQFSGLDLIGRDSLVYWKNCERYVIDTVLNAFATSVTLRINTENRPNITTGVGAILEETVGNVSHLINGITESDQQCIDSYYRNAAIDSTCYCTITQNGDTIFVGDSYILNEPQSITKLANTPEAYYATYQLSDDPNAQDIVVISDYQYFDPQTKVGNTQEIRLVPYPGFVGYSTMTLDYSDSDADSTNELDSIYYNGNWYGNGDTLAISVLDSIYLSNDTIYLRDGSGFVELSDNDHTNEIDSFYYDGLWYGNGDTLEIAAGSIDTFFAKNESVWKVSGDTLLDYGAGVNLDSINLGSEFLYRYRDDESNLMSAFRGGFGIDYFTSGNFLGIRIDTSEIATQHDLSLITDTTLSEEEVEDIVGGMVTGNTETLIDVTYQDADGTIDFVVEDDLSLYDNSTSGFVTSSGITSLNGLTNSVLTITTDQSSGLSDFDVTSVGTDIDIELPFEGGLNGLRLGYLAENSAGTTTAVGPQACRYMTGGNNIGIGKEAVRGQSGLGTGSNNVGIGIQSLRVVTSGINNVGIGSFAGAAITTGSYNFSLGEQALVSLTTGSNNIGIGRWAGRSITTTDDNVAVGTFSFRTTNGSSNVGIGVGSGEMNTGSNNTFIGKAAGGNSGSASGCVFIGANSGYSYFGSNKLIIDNTSLGSSSLIFGDFSTNELTINGELTVTDLTGGAAVGGIAYDATNQLVSTDLPLTDLDIVMSGTSALFNNQSGTEVFRVTGDKYVELAEPTSNALTVTHQSHGTKLIRTSTQNVTADAYIDFQSVETTTGSEISGSIVNEDITSNGSMAALFNITVNAEGTASCDAEDVIFELHRNGVAISGSTTTETIENGIRKTISWNHVEVDFAISEAFKVYINVPAGCTDLDIRHAQFNAVGI